MKNLIMSTQLQLRNFDSRDDAISAYYSAGYKHESIREMLALHHGELSIFCLFTVLFHINDLAVPSATLYNIQIH